MLTGKHFSKKHCQTYPMLIFLMEFIRYILSEIFFLILRRLWSTLLLYFVCGACGANVHLFQQMPCKKDCTHGYRRPKIFSVRHW